MGGPGVVLKAAAIGVGDRLQLNTRKRAILADGQTVLSLLISKQRYLDFFGELDLP